MTNTYTLITGGSKGIGKALAIECASRGNNILLVALPCMELEEAASEIKVRFKVMVRTLAIDLREADAPERVYQWCIENSYQVDTLINNAGVAGTSVFEHSEPEYNDTRILVNIRALVLLTHLFLPMLRAHSAAYILNVGSLSAYFSIPFKAVYSASKSFVLQFTRALRIELANTNINISVVCPNGVETNTGTYTRIAAHGLMGRLTKIGASELARISIDGMLQGKEVIIPKAINRMLLVISKLIPRWLERRMLKQRFMKEVRVTKI